jgi:hypothetical protein
MPKKMPRRPAATAPPPTRRSARDHAQMPAAIARIPIATGSAAVRAASGGSASQNASAPSRMPTIPIVRGDVQRISPKRAASAVRRSPFVA